RRVSRAPAAHRPGPEGQGHPPAHPPAPPRRRSRPSCTIAGPPRTSGIRWRTSSVPSSGSRSPPTSAFTGPWQTGTSAAMYGMALVNFVENFERFLKELAAECVDCLAPFVAEDRFNVFEIQATALASHFATDTIGKSLCESATWLDCE